MKKSQLATGRALSPTGLTLSGLALLSFATVATAQTPPSAPLEVPAKKLVAPPDVSPQLQKIIGAPLRTNWDLRPKTGEEWKPVADAGAEALMKNVPGMMERMKVKVEKTTIDGVRAFILTPETIAPENVNRQLIHMHGGCYVLNPREASLPEALFMAGFGHIKVVSVEYRMPPEAVFPGGARRRHHRLQGAVEDDAGKEHGVVWNLGRRRAGARNGAEGEGARTADAGRDRLGHADV